MSTKKTSRRVFDAQGVGYRQVSVLNNGSWNIFRFHDRQTDLTDRVVIWIEEDDDLFKPMGEEVRDQEISDPVLIRALRLVSSLDDLWAAFWDFTSARPNIPKTTGRCGPQPGARPDWTENFQPPQITPAGEDGCEVLGIVPPAVMSRDPERCEPGSSSDVPSISPTEF